jgi:hypothetical protein
MKAAAAVLFVSLAGLAWALHSIAQAMPSLPTFN